MSRALDALSRLREMNALLADDFSFTGMLLSNALTKLEHDIQQAASGTQRWRSSFAAGSVACGRLRRLIDRTLAVPDRSSDNLSFLAPSARPFAPSLRSFG